MRRYKIIDLDELERDQVEGELGLRWPLDKDTAGWCSAVVDTVSGEAVWTDANMQPEDAVLRRDLSVLVDLMNEAAGNA